MSTMAAAPPPAAPRLDTVLSFSEADADAVAVAESATPTLALSDAASDSDTDAEFEFAFAFAPPLSPGAGGPALAPADDLFAHGRIVAAYPLFDRHLLVADDHNDHASSAATSPDRHPQQRASTTAPPSPDAYCAWAPRSAPGSPSRAATAAFPKSSSTGEARRFWRLRDLVAGGGGRSHSDGKEKFVFLHSSCKPTATAAAPSSKPSVQKQGKKQKGGKTEMDMATAHRLFYGKPGAGATALAGDRPRQHQQSFLPYRGFFASAHVLGRSHHPY